VVVIQVEMAVVVVVVGGGGGEGREWRRGAVGEEEGGEAMREGR